MRDIFSPFPKVVKICWHCFYSQKKKYLKELIEITSTGTKNSLHRYLL